MKFNIIVTWKLISDQNILHVLPILHPHAIPRPSSISIAVLPFSYINESNSSYFISAIDLLKVTGLYLFNSSIHLMSGAFPGC